MEKLELKGEDGLIVNSLIPINVKEEYFDIVMNIYEQALDEMYCELTALKRSMAEIYGCDIISNITKRMKTPESIIKKMQKNNYELNYKSLIENINDIAGVRVVCTTKNNIYATIDVLSSLPNIKIIKEKDYLSKSKKSGYSGYHLIIERLVEIENRTIPVKVEIQLRTMAMDFWATNEHKIKYKTNNKLSKIDSMKMVVYAKVLNFIDNRISKIRTKQENIKVLN